MHKCSFICGSYSHVQIPAYCSLMYIFGSICRSSHLQMRHARSIPLIYKYGRFVDPFVPPRVQM